MSTGLEVPTTSVPRPWRARVFVTASEQRLRLPRDLIGTATGTVVVVISWASVAAGVNTPVTVVIPTWISWLVTGVAVCGTTAFIVVAVLLCIVAGRLTLVGHVVIAAGGAGLVAWGVAHWLGQGTPAAPPLVAVTFATAFMVIRILGVPLRTPLWVLVSAGALAQVFDAHLVPLGAVAAAALGATAGAAVSFGFGTPDVAPTVTEAGGFLDQLGVTVTGLVRSATVSGWGATRFTGTANDGSVLDVDVYGRDAPEGQFLARVWRFLWIRRSTLDLRLRRIDHIEHSAGMMLWAGSRGVGAPTVVRAGRVEPTDDAVLVTVRPSGTRLADLAPEDIDAADLVALWEALDRLSGAGLALNSISADNVVLDDAHRMAFLEFAATEAMASVETRGRDAASLLVATAGIVGPERAVAAAIAALGSERVEELLPLIQPQATAITAVPHGPRTKKAFTELRLSAAKALGVDPVEPRPLARFQVSQLLMLLGTFFGLWLLVSQLVGLTGIGEILQDSIWWWVVATLLITQATSATEAFSMSGTVPVAPPIGPLTLLRFAMNFTGMIGGTVATTATVVRFNQRLGLAPGVALSSGIVYSVAGFIVQICLTLVTLCFAADEFHREHSGAAGSGPENLQLILYGVVLLSFIGGIAFVVPKIRRAIISRLAPRLAPAWNNVRLIAQTPSKLARIFGGAAITQLMMATGLGFAIFAVHASASFGGLLIVCTFTALVGGMAPVPGGMGVMEASYISGLGLLGVPQDQAIAATLIYRASTTYLPPLWGWGALVWLRRHDAL
ncbi:MAG: lysylphosphatidylglycerol synthase transmembrane domain-containing protein [Acidimicrobiales bacterium]